MKAYVLLLRTRNLWEGQSYVCQPPKQPKILRDPNWSHGRLGLWGLRPPGSWRECSSLVKMLQVPVF